MVTQSWKNAVIDYRLLIMDKNTIANLKKHDFIFLTELGKGGFGVVMKVRHEISGQDYAVKKLNKRVFRVIRGLVEDIW